MTDAFAQLPYRPCVGVMLVNAQGRVFVGQRIDTRGIARADGDFAQSGGGEGDAWQMPQGGIDPGEDIRTAALRELAEETGVSADKAEIVAISAHEHLYDLPAALLGKLWKGRYRGQRQTWVLMRFLGSDADVRLDAHDPAEFAAWKWVDPAELPGLIVPFKRAVYAAVVAEFEPLI